jgi:uncharacterized protein (TIGR02118 family)
MLADRGAHGKPPHLSRACGDGPFARDRLEEKTMHKALVLYETPDDPDHFREYYVNKHLPLAATIPGVRRMGYSFDVAAMGWPAPWFCVFEMEFDSAEVMGAAMGSPEGQAVAADVANYSPAPPTIVHFPVTDL